MKANNQFLLDLTRLIHSLKQLQDASTELYETEEGTTVMDHVDELLKIHGPQEVFSEMLDLVESGEFSTQTSRYLKLAFEDTGTVVLR